MRLFRRHAAERLARRETVLLALLASRRDGWSAGDLRRHVGGRTDAIRVMLARREQDGRIRSWWTHNDAGFRRRYGLAEGEIR